MPFLLAIFTIIIIKNTHKLRVQSFKHCLYFLIFFSIQYFLNLFDTFV